MSGILGIWNRDDRPVDRDELFRLRGTLAHRGGDGGVEIRGSAGLACCLSRITPESVTETQPLVSASGAVLVFDGRLDNRQELLALLKPIQAVSDDSSDSALVLAAYDALGDTVPERLNGDFALGLFDPRRNKMLVARDPVGVRPLYYYATPELFLFASEIKALLAHAEVAAHPADEVLADFLFNGMRSEDVKGLTFFRGILSVLPAHLALVSPEKIVTRRYWDFDPTRKLRITSFQEATEGFRHHFEQSVRRRMRSTAPVAVSVSGGVDSSAIFCVAETLRRSDRAPHPALLGMSYTSPDGAPSDEKAFLIPIERAYGVEITRFDDLPRGSTDGSRDGIRQAEMPFLGSDWSGTHAFLTGVRQHGARVLLTGHWGDQFLSDDAYLVDLCFGGRLREAWKHLNEYSRWLGVEDPHYFRKRLFNGLVSHAAPDAMLPALRLGRDIVRRAPEVTPWYTEGFRRRAAGRTLRRGRPRNVTAHAGSLYRAARSRYHALCMDWNNKVAASHGLEMAFPFLDRDLIAFLMAVPGEMVGWGGVPKGLLREALRDVLPAAIAQRASKADFTSLANEAMARDHAEVVRCLEAGGAAVAFGYVRREALDEIARRRPSADESTCTLSWALKDLLTLELWLQLFFGAALRQSKTEVS
jgi:asparagine synthase (glutamine-hydrolysing)